MRRKIKRFISRNWLWITAGLILTEVFAKIAYAERGYMAFGGEYLTLPILLMLVEMSSNIGDLICDMFGTEEE